MAKQNIDPVQLALLTAKNATPASNKVGAGSVSTPPTIKPSLNLNQGGLQAVSTAMNTANTINNTPKPVATQRSIPKTGSDEIIWDDKVDNNTVKLFSGNKDEIIWDDKPTTTQNIAGGAVATIYDSGLAEPGKRVARFLGENITKPLVGLLPEGGLKTKLLSNIEGNIKGMQDPVATLTPKADTESTAFKTTKLIGDIAQTAILPSAGGVVKGQGFIKGALNLAKQGAIETAKFTGISDKRLPTKEELAYGVGGNVLLGGAFAGLPKVKDMIKGTPPDVNKVVGKIIQGKEKDIKPAIDALSQIDTKGIKTYKELGTKLRESNQKLMQSVDEILTKDTRQVTPNMFTKTVRAGDQVISKDYMGDVIDNLTELYSKGGDIDKQAKILNVKDLYKKGALKLKDANDLLRVYSSEFGDKAFSKVNQEPLTSVSAQQYENIRKGAKELLRSQFADDGLKQLDQAYSKSTKTLKFIDDMSDKVQKLQQKIQERGFIENITRKLGRGVDLITGGGVRGFLTSFLPSNIGNKVLNSLDLQEQLAKNLDDFAKAIGNIEKGTAQQVDLDLIKKYANSISTPSLTSMGKPPQVSK